MEMHSSKSAGGPSWGSRSLSAKNAFTRLMPPDHGAGTALAAADHAWESRGRATWVKQGMERPRADGQPRGQWEVHGAKNLTDIGA